MRAVFSYSVVIARASTSTLGLEAGRGYGGYRSPCLSEMPNAGSGPIQRTEHCNQADATETQSSALSVQYDFAKAETEGNRDDEETGLNARVQRERVSPSFTVSLHEMLHSGTTPVIPTTCMFKPCRTNMHRKTCCAHRVAVAQEGGEMISCHEGSIDAGLKRRLYVSLPNCPPPSRPLARCYS